MKNPRPKGEVEGVDAYFAYDNNQYYFLGFCYTTYESEEMEGC